MEKTLIQLIKEVASKLQNSKLKRLNGKEIGEMLEQLKLALELDSKDEAIVFTALFDRGCSGKSCNLEEIAGYFNCSMIEIMEYAHTLPSLTKKGLVISVASDDCRLVHQNYMVSNYVIDCVLANQKPELQQTCLLEKGVDQYDFCEQISKQIQDESVPAEVLFQFVESMERDHAELSFVKEVKARVPNLPDRVFFYGICFDFFDNQCDGSIRLTSVLMGIYGTYSICFREQRSLLDGTHPLILSDLVEMSGEKEEVLLTVTGQCLFLGDDFKIFGKHYAGLSRYAFAREVKEYIHGGEYNAEGAFSLKRLARRIRVIEKENPQLTCVQKVKELIEEEDCRALFYLVCNACATGNPLSMACELEYLYPINERIENLKRLKNETHKLQRANLVELYSVSSLFGEHTQLQLTERGKELYFEEDASLYIEKVDKRTIIQSSDIKEKRLFFSGKEREQLSLIGNTLQEQNYQALVERLDAKGLSRGIAILLYGAPGTGKTESVMQWARTCGRNIVHVDISAAKSMWYGESEKIVKEIFVRYKRMCNSSAIKPILLFNEADAIFSTRRDISGGRSIDQTENAIQNIILEEMEKLDGILIATTNLVSNLDKAFERRFLFKVRLDKPTMEVKRNIWMDKLSGLSTDDATYLSSHFDFSGGEIDNIVRKATMMEVIDGVPPSCGLLTRLCEDERIGKQSTRIGF